MSFLTTNFNRIIARDCLDQYNTLKKKYKGIPERINGNSAFSTLLALMMQKEITDNNEFEGMVSELTFLIEWAQNGCPIFSLSHNIAAQLLLTEASSVKKQFLKFPYDAFLIELPGPDSYIKITSHDNKRLIDVNAIFFCKYKRLNPKMNENTVIRGKRAKSMLNLLDTYRMRGTQAAIDVINEFEDDTLADSYFMKAVNYQEGIGVFNTSDEPEENQNIEDWIENPKGLNRNETKITDVDENAISTSIRLITNLAIYTTSKNAVNVKEEKLNEYVKVKKGRDSEMVNVIPSTRFFLDSDVKISQELKQSAKDFARRNYSDSDSKRWYISRQETVIGHFKTQRYGKGNTELKQIFIAPYMRGKGQLGEAQKTYKVEK